MTDPNHIHHEFDILPIDASRGGGSDAFSGITGNPLVGEVSKELLTRGSMTPERD